MGLAGQSKSVLATVRSATGKKSFARLSLGTWETRAKAWESLIRVLRQPEGPGLKDHLEAL